MVTKLPNHWCANSWAMTMATRWRVAAEDSSGSTRMAVSR